MLAYLQGSMKLTVSKFLGTIDKSGPLKNTDLFWLSN